MKFPSRADSSPAPLFPFRAPSAAATKQIVGAALCFTGGRPRSAPVDAALTYPVSAPPTPPLAAAPAALGRFVELVPPRRRARSIR